MILILKFNFFRLLLPIYKLTCKKILIPKNIYSNKINDIVLKVKLSNFKNKMY
jgi:hypothetical protein